MDKKRIAIVTGASGGLGREFVKILCEKENIDYVWAIARNQQKLDFLKAEFGQKIITISFDLTDRTKINMIDEMLKDYNLIYLVNNAGYGKFCSYKDLNTEQSLNMIDLNVNAVVGMCVACLGHMESGAKIINIASQASFQPLPYMNIYAATKSFVRSYTRALNVELKSRNITATAVCPGWMNTPFLSVGNIGAEKAPSNFLFQKGTDEVAKKAIKDADKGKDISVYSLPVKVQHIGAKLLPEKLVMKIWSSIQHL